MLQTGQCPKCRVANSYTAIQCIECGQRLPWADAVQHSASQATTPAAASPQPVPTIAPQKPEPAPVPAAASASTFLSNPSWLTPKMSCGCIAFFFFIFLPFSCLLTNNFGTGGDHKLGRGAAYYEGRQAILRQLKSPSTAKFPQSFEPGVTITENGDTFIISSYVDAQNSFGAMLRSRWTATVQRTPDGKDMHVVSAALLE